MISEMMMIPLLLQSAGMQKPVEKQEKEHPDILFIAIDDMNDWTTLFDENNPIRTPNLKRLAERGTFFSMAFSSVPFSVPSRASLLSGLSPATTGCYANDKFSMKVWETDPRMVSLPQYMREHGYDAWGAGKIFGDHWVHYGNDPRGTEYSWNGFNNLVQIELEHQNGYTEGMLAKKEWDWGIAPDRAHMGDEQMVEYISDVMEKEHERPVFMAAGIFKPHLPFYAPEEYYDMYPLEDVRLPELLPDDMNDIPKEGVRLAHRVYELYQNTHQYEAPDVRSYRKFVQGYHAAVTYSDSVLGELLDKLEETGRADNTIIVLWADHGYHLGDKESMAKTTLWDKANHVPFIIVAPGVTEPGSVCERPVSLLDIYPTVLELAGLPAKADNEGQSLVPLLKNPDRKWTRPAISTMQKGNHTVRTSDWRYIRYHDGTEELYDHRNGNDPWEWNNLAGNPEYEKVMKKLRKWIPQDVPFEN